MVIRRVLAASTGANFEYVSGMLSSVIIVRSLTPDMFGEYSFVVWLAGWMALIAVGPVATAIIKFLPEQLESGDQAALAGYWGALQKVYLFQVAIGLVVLVAISQSPLGHTAHIESIAMLAVVGVSSLARARFRVLSNLAQARERFGLEAVALVAASVFNLLAVAITGYLFPSIQVFLAIYMVSGAFQYVVLRTLLGRAGLIPQAGRLDRGQRPRLVKFLGPSALLVGLSLLGNRAAEFFFLKASVAPAILGFFAIANTLSKSIVDVLTVGLTNVLAPMVSRYGSNPRGIEVVELTNKYLRLFAVLSVGIAAITLLTSTDIVLVLYGQKYADAGLACGALALAAAIAISSTPLTIVLTMNDRQNSRIIATVFSILLSLVFAFLFVPKYGLWGAVVSSIATALGWTGSTFFLAKRIIDFRLDAWLLFRIGLAASIACGLAWLISHQLPLYGRLVLSSLVSSVFYALLASILKVFTASELGLVFEVFERWVLKRPLHGDLKRRLIQRIAYRSA
jgi:O-antigen/teichoic acid export membrane protein